ncbi:MAG: sensor hybrid histidine kinase [Gammaproteobacteria bacterium]|nr:sensor hybrid histidine kinase [Gammaproteobacteria bacterium]
MQQTTRAMRKTGLEVLGDRPWGSHFCVFYETDEDLIEMLVPYFKAGVENNELCFWVLSDSLTEEGAWRALNRDIPDADRPLIRRSIEFMRSEDCYLKQGIFDLNRVTEEWGERLKRALDAGFDGIRVSGYAGWPQTREWPNFWKYEGSLNESIVDQRMIVLCTYSLIGSTGFDILDVAHTHQCAVSRRIGSWQIIETAALKEAKEEIERLNEELEQRVIDRTRALRRSEAYLAEAQSLSHTGSFGWNAASGKIWFSAETFRIFEFDRANPPDLARIVQQTHPQDRAFLEQTLDRARHEKTDFDLECRLLMPDGSVKHLQVVARAMVDDSGHVEFVGAVMDITRRRRAEEVQRVQESAREEMQRQLQQAAKMEAIGRLAGGIAHDFNNILGAILGYGELAQDNLSEGSAARRQVDQVMHAGARAKGLVDNILAFSRSGVSERVPLHLQSVVEETLELLAPSLPVEVRLERRLNAVDTAVLGDATQFHQVTMNLCTNAVQAMDQGGLLTVTLDRVTVGERHLLSHGTLSAGHYVRLTVSDTGSGIRPAVLERMFDPFFTTKRVGDGTGLGLALVHGIVADFGGTIDVETQIDAGTTFTIWLPAADETPKLWAESPGDVPRGHGETVMIVDDERPLVALAEETLARLGYEPVGFDSSVAALQAFRAEPQRFDLVLTDETMPDLTGTELAREIRQLRPNISIILMSGYSDTELSERAQAAGIIDVLRKPLARRDIAEPVARALRAGS